MVNIVERVDDLVRIDRVLISVSDKYGLDVLVPGLIEVNPDVHIYSTGGTYRTIAGILGEDRAAEYLSPVARYTGQPETQGGLVKTLDFKIYLGLLTETHNASHQADMARLNAVNLDMVVVNLYPFETTVARPDVTVEEARANIDIGGPTMLRAAAKNYLRVVPVVNPRDYESLLDALRAGDGALDLATRFAYARQAFMHTAQYDTAISRFLETQDPADVPGVYSLTS
jgi:phosphoribosylaminoimidazolecarboxamide formyltransferase/IMP cyclohydrolase